MIKAMLLGDESYAIDGQKLWFRSAKAMLLTQNDTSAITSQTS